jgi:ABC-type nitrate/sulfonate/bicarbonate transport system substrate-binding protein
MSGKKRIARWRPIIIMSIVAITLLFSANAQAAGREKMKILYTSNYDFLMDVPIAIEKGYFDTLGLDIEAVDIPSNATRFSLYPQEDINGGFLQSEAALTFAEKGFDMIMVSGIGNRTFNFSVLAKSPIRSLKDFDGKTIASVAHPANPALALDYDMKPMNIKANVVSSVSPADRLSMLLSGRVDIILSDAAVEARLGDDIRLVHKASTSKYLWNSCGWWFKPDFIKNHPEAVRKFVQGLGMAKKVINENPAEAVRVYSKYNKLKSDSYKKPFELAQFDNPPVVYAYGLEQTYKIMKGFGVLKKEIDTSKMVDGRFAKSITTPY